jgi:hypothetical protein
MLPKEIKKKITTFSGTQTAFALEFNLDYWELNNTINGRLFSHRVAEALSTVLGIKPEELPRKPRKKYKTISIKNT